MTGIRRHYDGVAAELQPGPGGVLLPSRIHVIVLVSRLQHPGPAGPRVRPRHPPAHA